LFSLSIFNLFQVKEKVFKEDDVFFTLGEVVILYFVDRAYRYKFLEITSFTHFFV